MFQQFEWMATLFIGFDFAPIHKNKVLYRFFFCSLKDIADSERQKIYTTMSHHKFGDCIFFYNGQKKARQSVDSNER